MSLPAVRTVIPNWNGVPHIMKALESLDVTGYPKLEITVVDNASEDDSVSMIRARYPGVHVIENLRNLGFGVACNIGSAGSSADYLWFLNSDTMVEPDSLTNLVRFMESESKVAIAQSVAVGKDESFLGAFLTPFGFLGHITRSCGRGPEPGGRIFSPMGASMLVRRSSFVEVGGFESSFWLYFEETDLAWRLHLLGYEVAVVESSIVSHLSGASSNQLPFDVVQRHSFQNRIVTLYSNLGPVLVAPVMSIHVFSICLLWAISRVSGRPAEARALRDAVYNAWRNRSALQLRRRMVQRTRKVPDRALFPKYMRLLDLSWAISSSKWFVGSNSWKRTQSERSRMTFGTDWRAITSPLDESHVLVASHEFVKGPAHALERYLTKAAKELTMILLPFHYAPDTRVAVRSYKRGSLSKDVRIKLPGFTTRRHFIWIRDAVALVLILFKHARGKGARNIFVGIDPFNCAIILLLRRMRVLRGFVILYTIDLPPNRFKARSLNWIYHRIDRYCTEKVDANWNLSEMMETSRAKRWPNSVRSPAVIVPMGMGAIPEHAPPPVRRLVYVGHLVAPKGIQHVIRALPEIAQNMPDVTLDIVGTGSYEPVLKEMVRREGVEDRVRFFGYVESDEEVTKIVSRGGVGLAVYEEDADSLTRFTDPGKIKNYLAGGLPIVLTPVPPIAEELASVGCAVLVSADPGSVAQGVIKVLQDQDVYSSMAKSAVRMAKRFHWDDIFETAFRGVNR